MTGRGIPMTQSIPASKQDAVTLPAGEAAMLVRIAEVASEYERTHDIFMRGTLFKLAREWRTNWRTK